MRVCGGRKIHWNGKSGFDSYCIYIDASVLDMHTACYKTNAQKREMLSAVYFLLLLLLLFFFVTSFVFLFRYLHFTIWVHVHRKQQPCMVQHVENLWYTYAFRSMVHKEIKYYILHVQQQHHTHTHISCTLDRNLNSVLYLLYTRRWIYFAK